MGKKKLMKIFVSTTLAVFAVKGLLNLLSQEPFFSDFISTANFAVVYNLCLYAYFSGKKSNHNAEAHTHANRKN